MSTNSPPDAVRYVAWLLGAALLLTGCAADAAPLAASDVAAAPTTLARLNDVASAEPTAPTPQTELTTTTTTKPQLPPITITVAGDTSFTHGLATRDPLGEVSDLLSAADLTIVNLETTVAEDDVGRAIQKRFVFKSPPESAQLLADAGIDVAALANNHAFDYGPDATLRTIELLESAGVASAGAGATAEAAYTGIRLDVSGWDVAVLSFTRVPCDSPEPGETYIEEVAWACPQFEMATFDAVSAAADADLVVVMVHWGVQSRACPEPHQSELAEQWIARGADLIVGSHPHVLQGVAMIEGRWVLHSTGNFAFPSARNASADTALFTFNVSETDIGLAVEPIRIVEGRPNIANASRDRILDTLNLRSYGFSVDDGGRVAPSDRSGECG